MIPMIGVLLKALPRIAIPDDPDDTDDIKKNLIEKREERLASGGALSSRVTQRHTHSGECCKNHRYHRDHREWLYRVRLSANTDHR